MSLSPLLRGTHVTHRLYGNGTVLEEWSSWISCRSCYAELRPNQQLCDECERKGVRDDTGFAPAPIKCCGKGTYDVLFQDGKTHAVHARWLVVKPSASRA